MSGFMQTVSTINSALRTLIALVVTGLLGIGGWYGYTTYNAADIELREKTAELAEKQKRISALEGDLKTTKARLEKTETALRLLKVDHRLARLTVLDQGNDAGGEPYTLVEFVEINDAGEMIETPRQFRLAGKKVHVAAWTVKFEDHYVESAAIDRSTSLCLFKSIYGDGERPMDAASLDQAGTRPVAYRGAPPSELETKILNDFWNIANDKQKAEALGIDAAFETAVILEVIPGRRYRIDLRASGGLKIKPDGDAPPPKTPTG
jgi:hypothetical protein